MTNNRDKAHSRQQYWYWKRGGRRWSAKYAKQYRLTSKGKEAVNRSEDNRKTRYDALASTLKLASGCIKCGYNKHASALDFHHRDRATKKFTIGSSRGRGALASVLLEITKCDVLCSNCHRIQTYNENKKAKR